MRAAAVKSVWVVVGDVSVRDAHCQAVCTASRSVCCLLEGKAMHGQGRGVSINHPAA